MPQPSIWRTRQLERRESRIEAGVVVLAIVILFTLLRPPEADRVAKAFLGLAVENRQLKGQVDLAKVLKKT